MSDWKSPLEQLLNRILWDDALDPETVSITFIHRGAPGDRRSVSGTELRHVGHGYFELPNRDPDSLADTTQVPLHRILQVRIHDEIVWDRAKDTGGEAGRVLRDPSQAPALAHHRDEPHHEGQD